ncbi:hypothetical protein OAJ43_02830 [Nitrosomonadales bacterium]|nr:hypothetical protein [Nitrosomonadales bacterium]
MSLNQKNKGKLTLVGIAFLFFLPIVSSWYLVFYSDFKKNAIGTEHGELIEPVVNIGEIKAKEIQTRNEILINKKWILAFVQKTICDDLCKERYYQLRQIRLALGEDRDKVERLVISNELTNIDELKILYPGQKYIDGDDENYQSLIKQFKNYITDQDDPIFLIDPYGFLMMQYPKGTEPKGIIKDIEKLIKNSK